MQSKRQQSVELMTMSGDHLDKNKLPAEQIPDQLEPE